MTRYRPRNDTNDEVSRQELWNNYYKYPKDLKENINSMSENMEKSQKVNVNSRKRIKGSF